MKASWSRSSGSKVEIYCVVIVFYFAVMHAGAESRNLFSKIPSIKLDFETNYTLIEHLNTHKVL